MKYFTIPELTRSSMAETHNIDNTPDAIIISHLTEMTEKLLDPLREKWGAYCLKKGFGTGALRVSSGYRCLQVNKLVGGSVTSAHLHGYAADIIPINGKQTEFEKWVSEIFSKGKIGFDQIIIEKSKNSRWVHFGYKNQLGKQRKQCFKMNVK